MTDAEGKPPAFDFTAKKGFTLAIDISDPYILQDVVKITQECKGGIVKFIDKREPPDALVSDAEHAPFLQNQPYEKREQYIRYLPLVTKDAVRLKVPIIHTESFLEAWENHLKNKLRQPRKSLKRPFSNTSERESNSTPPPSNNALTRLVSTDVVIRDANPSYGVLYKHIKELPMMNLGEHYGSSLFHRANPDMEAKRKLELEREEKGEYKYEDAVSPPFKEYGPAKPVRPTLGYCEICKISSSNIIAHAKSLEHQKLVCAPGFYNELDTVLKDWNNAVFMPMESSDAEQGEELEMKTQMYTEFKEMRIPDGTDTLPRANNDATLHIPTINNNIAEDIKTQKSRERQKH